MPTIAESKRIAYALMALRTATSGSLTDDVRFEIAETLGWTTGVDPWPPAAGSLAEDVMDIFNDMGYEMFDDWTISRDTVTYPSTIGPDASAVCCMIIYYAILDPGTLYSSRSTIRNALWAQISSSNATSLEGFFTALGYDVNADLTITYVGP